LGTAETLFARFSDFLKNPRSADVKEFEWTGNQLRECIRDIQEDIDALDETIDIVRVNPQKFRVGFDCSG
jgi:hypothetical protein